jgi:TP901 family phage tail tape measure protein
MAGAVSLGTLSVRILADTTAVEKGVGNVLKRLSLAAGASLTVAIAQGIGEGLRNSAQLNASLARIQTLTSDAFNAKQVREFSNALGVDAVQSAEAVYTALSSGAKNVSEAQNEVAAAAKLARATNADLNSTVAAVTAGYNAYAASGISAADASDILFTIQKDGVGTMDALTSAIGQVLPSAANLGVSFKEIGADLAASTLTGKSYANAATGLKVVLQELGNSTSKVSKLFKQVNGKDVTDFIKGGGKVNDVIKTIVQTVGTGGLDEIFHAKGSAAAVKQLLVSVEGVDQATKDMAKSAGSVDTAFGVVDKSLSGQLNDLKIKMQNAFGSLGDTVLPGLVAQASGLFDSLSAAAKNVEPTLMAVGGDFKAIYDAVAPLVPSFSSMVGLISQLAPLIAAAATAMLAYKTYTVLAAAATALWDLATTIAAFISLASEVRTAAGAVALLDAAFAANPIGIIIGLVAGLAAGFVYLWQTSETFRDVVTNVWNDIVGAIGAGVSAILKLMVLYAEGPLEAFKIVLEGVGHLPSWLGGGVADGAAAAVGALIGQINDWRDTALGAISDVVNAAKMIPDQFGGDNASVNWGYGDDAAQRISDEMAKQGITSSKKVKIPNIFGGGGGGGGGGGSAGSAASKVADAVKKIKDSLSQLNHASKMSKDQIDAFFKTLEADTKDALSGKAEAAALKMEKKWNKSLDSMATHLATLHDKVTAELQFGTQVKQTVRELGSVASATEGISQTFFGVQNHLRAAVAQSNQFYQVFKKLEAMGLNDVSLGQLAAAGPASLGDAQALLAGGQQGITGKGGINDLQTQLDAAGDKIANKTADNYYNAGQSVSKGFLEGIQSQEKQLEATMDKLGKKAGEALKKALGIHSPSRVMHGIGGYVAEGLADGITAGGKKVSSASAGMAGQVIFGAGSVVVSANGREPMDAGMMAGKGLTAVLERQRAQSALKGLR